MTLGDQNPEDDDWTAYYFLRSCRNASVSITCELLLSCLWSTMHRYPDWQKDHVAPAVPYPRPDRCLCEVLIEEHALFDMLLDANQITWTTMTSIHLYITGAASTRLLPPTCIKSNPRYMSRSRTTRRDARRRQDAACCAIVEQQF